MAFRPRGISIVAILIAIVLAAISPAAAQNEEPSKDELEATIAALQTQAAALPEDPGTPASGSTGADSWNTATTAGNGFEVLTPAPVGTVDVIATGTYDGQRLPFVIHNNTDTAVEQVSVEGTVLDAAGALFAVGGDLLGTTPGWIEPGAVGIGYLYFDGIAFPPDATVDMAVSFQAAPTRSSFGTLEATVAEWNQVDDRIVGVLANPHASEITGPLSIAVVCLVADGAILSYNEAYTESDAIPPGGQVPFQVTLDPPSCEFPLIAAQGFSF